MATVVNTRDVILQAATSRLVATSVTGTTIGGTFTKAKNGGTTISPSSLVLTTVVTGFTNPTYEWSYSTNGTTYTTLGGSSNSYTITNSAFAAIVSSASLAVGASVTYKVVARQNGYNESNTTFTVTYLAEADDPVFAAIDKPATTVQASNTGVVSVFTNTGATITATRAGTPLTYGTGADQFDIDTANITITPVGGVILGTNNSGIYTNITAMDSAQDSVTVTYPVRIRNLAGAITTRTVTQVFTKSKAGSGGASGINAVTLSYTNDSLTIPVTNAGIETWSGSGGQLQVYDGSTLLTLNTTTQTASTPATNGYYNLDITKVSGDTLTEPSISGTTTITIGTWAGDLTTATVYRITAYIRRNDGSTITISRDVSISPSNAGNDGRAYWLMTSAPAVQKSITDVYTPSTVTYNIKTGVGTNSPTDYSGRFIIATSTNGTTYVDQYTSATDQNTYTYTVPTGIKTIRARAYLAGGTTTLLDELITSIVSDGATGAAGASSTSISYTNSSLSVPITNTGSITWTGSGGQLQVYDGSTLLTLNTTTQTASTPATNGYYNLDITKVSGDTLTEPSISGTTTITIGDWSGTLTTATVYRITAYVKRLDGTAITISIDVSISPSRQGNNATAYWLTTSAPAVQKSIANQYTPSSVTYSIKTTTGTSSPSDYSGRFIIATSTNGTTYTDQYISATDQNTYTYTVPASIKTIRVRAYLAGGTSTLLDELITTIVSDGATGDSGYTLTISGGTRSISYDSSGSNPNPASSSAFTAVLYQGSTVVSPTYTWSSSGVLSGTNTGTSSYTPSISGSHSTSSTTVSLSVTHNGVTISESVPISINRVGATGSGTQGNPGASAVVAYKIVSSTSLPAAPAVLSDGTGAASTPTPGAATGYSNWYTQPATSLSANEWLFESSGTYNSSTGYYDWNSPAYLATFKVGQLSALTADMGTLNVTSTLTVGSSGSIFSSGKTSYGNTTAGFFLGYDSTTYKFRIGDSTKSLSWDGSSLSIVGSVISNSNANGSVTLSGNQMIGKNASNTLRTQIDWDAGYGYFIASGAGTNTVVGEQSSTSTDAHGVVGKANGGWGVYGESQSNYGVVGKSTTGYSGAFYAQGSRAPVNLGLRSAKPTVANSSAGDIMVVTVPEGNYFAWFDGAKWYRVPAGTEI